jgi:hypothetical protein
LRRDESVTVLVIGEPSASEVASERGSIKPMLIRDRVVRGALTGLAVACAVIVLPRSHTFDEIIFVSPNDDLRDDIVFV